MTKVAISVLAALPMAPFGSGAQAPAVHASDEVSFQVQTSWPVAVQHYIRVEESLTVFASNGPEAGYTTGPLPLP